MKLPISLLGGPKHVDPAGGRKALVVGLPVHGTCSDDGAKRNNSLSNEQPISDPEFFSGVHSEV